jgi:hypothetical protein
MCTLQKLQTRDSCNMYLEISKGTTAEIRLAFLCNYLFYYSAFDTGVFSSFDVV